MDLDEKSIVRARKRGEMRKKTHEVLPADQALV